MSKDHTINTSIKLLEVQWAEPVSLAFHSALRKHNTEPSIGASHQISIHLAKQFQRKRFLEIDQTETRIAYGSHVCYLPYMFPTKFLFIWLSSFREEDFQKSTNQKQALPMAAMFVYGSKRNEQSLQRTLHRCFLSIFGSVGIAVSEEEVFRNRPIRYKNCLWQP